MHEHRPRVERADVRRSVEAHTPTTRYARDVGFDAVEIHLGHNYLASSFLSPKVNHRKDAAHLPSCRVPRRILTSVGEAADSETAALAEMKIAPGGLWLDGSLPFAKMIESDGHLDAFELTGGSSLFNPMYLFRGDVPLKEMAETHVSWTRTSGPPRGRPARTSHAEQRRRCPAPSHGRPTP
ncbi:oxidoreductase [Rhodococcus qingshengii]|uniref:oxidoreductase n=1 Tax=Rhodococcus qingshengii TaxID=334542 RepID=UPI0027E2BE7A|nr:hypothetical protein [Rhodococcus qingshengii]